MEEKYSLVTFICGMVSLIFNPLLILSIVALIFSAKAEQEGEGDNTFRTVGKGVAILSMVIWAIIMICYVLFLLISLGVFTATFTSLF